MMQDNQEKEDEVLRRMLATPPTPHKPKPKGLTAMTAKKPKLDPRH